MREIMGIPADLVNPMRNDYFHRYGTTLKGLEAEQNVNTADYLAFVHDLPLNQYIQRNDTLITILKKLPYPKVILTNADRAHCERVLNLLEIRPFFSQIVDILDLAPHCKPAPDAFKKALTLLENPDPGECMLFEDAIVNLNTAHNLGFITVQVGRRELTSDSAYRVDSISHIDALFDEDLALRVETIHE